MSTVAIPPAVHLPVSPSPLRRFTVHEYHRMIEAGVFSEDDRFELLEGWIVEKMPRNPPHDAMINVIADLLRALLPPGWSLRIQSALTTGESEPEPDLAVVRGEGRDYLGRHPDPRDVALVIEVADSSLSQDRQVKGRVYARAGIPCYWIVNLSDRRVEVYTEPSGPNPEPCYRSRRDAGPQDNLDWAVGGQAVKSVPARDLLP